MAKSLGRAIEQAREELEVSRAALARSALLDPGELSRIESGQRQNPSFSVVCRIATGLGLSLDELAFRAGLLKRRSPASTRPPAKAAAAIGGLDSLDSLLRRASAQISAIRKRLNPTQ